MLRDINLKFPDAQSLADMSGWKEIEPTRMSMEVTVTIVSKLGYFTYLGDLQPTYIGVMIQLLSTMDIPVESYSSDGIGTLNPILRTVFGFLGNLWPIYLHNWVVLGVQGRYKYTIHPNIWG